MKNARFVAQALNGSALVSGVFDTKAGKFEVNPKTGRNFAFTVKSKLDATVQMFNDAADAEAKAATAKRVEKAKATRAAKRDSVNQATA